MSKFIDEARQLAAQCWCHETTSSREMDSTLAEVVAWKIAAWMDTAASMQAKLDEKDAEIVYLKSYIEGCNDSFATIMAEKENYKTEIAGLKRCLKDICEEWNEDCNPTCNSHAHDETCKRANIAEAKKAMRLEIARLKSVDLEPVAYFDYDEEGGLFLKGRNDAICHWKECAEQGWKLKPLYPAEQINKMSTKEE